MKITVMIIRILAGLIYLFSAAVLVFKLMPQPELTGSLKVYMEGIMASGYLLPMVKVVEVSCAIAFVSGFFVPLAAVIIFPININILMVHMLLAPEGLPVAIFLMINNLLLAYYYRDRYKTLFIAK
jgi:uncharacterized membrane protein YphA (DoxX/SURF4 family)